MEGQRILAEISDDGTGIPEEHFPGSLKDFTGRMLQGAAKLEAVVWGSRSVNTLLKRMLKTFMYVLRSM